ncbi:CD209 antigen-like protein E [Lingula anatina]|uniref:CD209 antigen-like protein E n=1 Tax=Lingula anatina TaxID=7574 RepID=A0A1S3HNK3_LINAN|nr:CD209 antigen-like protein E [Lingula anatina]|eukprot:XP_013387111.1 CD209 antigen-like protein E [Lingula anatina]
MQQWNRTCATGWVAHNSTCYQFNANLQLSWYDAATYCRSQGAEMVTIQSKRTQNFIEDKVRDMGFQTEIWLGGSDIDLNPKELHWADGTKITEAYSNWEPAQPKKSSKSLCVQMRADDRKWTTSEHCLHEQQFICQVSDDRVVFPPTVLPG